MDIKQMLILRQLLEELAGQAEGSYYLSKEEKRALHHFDEESNLGEDHRLHLMRLARLADIEPWQLMYLRRLAGLGVTAIE
jgi:hypothetical protein